MSANPILRPLLSLLSCALLAVHAWSQGHTVSFVVEVQPAQPASGPSRHGAMTMPHSKEMSPVVAWLTPLDSTPLARSSITLPPTHARAFTLTQKDKQFSPHVLVIPTGSAVEFPNLDPFFHNVFSLFNGRRFDLGLYEAGQQRTVRFDHDGVSYIFCNIHPEMGAVIITLGTPFYAESTKDGSVVIPNIPPGDYRLQLWAENIAATDLTAATETIHVPPQDLRLNAIKLKESAAPARGHLNKFGEHYSDANRVPY